MAQTPKSAGGDPHQESCAGRSRAKPAYREVHIILGARRELWLTFLLKLLIYVAYSVTNKTMVLWLSRDLGFSDQAAGAIGRLGLGAGHDGVHAARRFAHRRDRAQAARFTWALRSARSRVRSWW